MPSTLLHLTFAELVYPSLDVDHINFLSGNLIPDETNDKKTSHYRVPFPNSRLQIPKLQIAKKDLLIKDDALKLGMYAHLYLDHYFIKDFLVPEFVWNFEKMEVTNPRTGKMYEYHEFISKDGFYSAYTEFNDKLIADGYIDMTIVNSIPTLLPETDLPIFDNRRTQTWRDELDYYLAQHPPYTGTFLDYNRLMMFIEKTAKQFILEIN